MQMDKVFGDTGCDYQFVQSFAPAATAAASSVEQAFTPTAGAHPAFRVGDLVQVTGPAAGNNVTIGNCRINTTGQIVITFINPTAGALTHATGNFTIRVSRACQ